MQEIINGHVLHRINYEELCSVAAERVKDDTDRLMEARDQLTAMLSPDQLAVFGRYDDLTVLQMGAIQLATARQLCPGIA